MTLEFAVERFWFSLLLLLSTILFLFWSRRRARIDTVPQTQLLFAACTGLLYGLFRIWVGCELVLPTGFQ